MNNPFDRRKANFNYLILMILLILFIMTIYNQRLIINTHNHIIEIDNKITGYFNPISDLDLPEWND